MPTDFCTAASRDARSISKQVFFLLDPKLATRHLPDFEDSGQSVDHGANQVGPATAATVFVDAA